MSNVTPIQRNHLSLIEGDGSISSDEAQAFSQVLDSVKVKMSGLTEREEALVRETYLSSVNPILEHALGLLVSGQGSVATAIDKAEKELVSQIASESN